MKALPLIVASMGMLPFAVLVLGPWVSGRVAFYFFPLPGDKIYEAAAHLLVNDPTGWKGGYPIHHPDGFEVRIGEVLYRNVSFKHREESKRRLSKAWHKRQAILQELAEANALAYNVVSIKRRA